MKDTPQNGDFHEDPGFFPKDPPPKVWGPEDPDHWDTVKLAIVGLGLMGGSLAMALKGKVTTLLGIDLDPQAVTLAQQQHIVDLASVKPVDLLPQADVIVLAAPVNAIIALIKELPQLHPGPVIVIDLGSTKVKIMEAMQALPDRFDPIGGHPMCGKEVSGLANADPGLFQDAPFAFTALERTTPKACRFGEWLAVSLGACPLWIDANTHDRWVAATSHLPYLAANALAGITPLESAPLAGPGFRSATRLAMTPPAIMIDILMTNQAAILDSLSRFTERLDKIERLLKQGNYSALQDLLSEGAWRKQEISPSSPLRKSPLCGEGKVP